MKLFSILIFATLIALAGCDQKGPAERAGETIDESMGEMSDSMKQAGEELDEAAEEAKNSMEEAANDVDDEIDEMTN